MADGVGREGEERKRGESVRAVGLRRLRAFIIRGVHIP